MILIIEDDIAVQTSLNLLLKNRGFDVNIVSSPDEAYPIVSLKTIDLVLLDMNFSLETSGKEGLFALKRLKEIAPELPIILMTGWGSISIAVEGMKNGASDFINKPWENTHLLKTIETTIELSNKNVTKTVDFQSRKELDKQFGFGNIIGENPILLNVLKIIGRISPTDASVLITGESGTGKELIAEAIHKNSKRKDKPFIKVNLGGISSSLFESEMFGHKKGAFTDAKNDRIGRFQKANTGTIFLDEIGDLDLNSQVKLLRVLQDRTYEILGDSKSRSLDVRIICATNRNLKDLIAQNKFREDLFYRINLISVHLPSLRERQDDVILLVKHFIDTLKKTYERGELGISQKALDWLKKLPLMGNIRELKNLVERAVLVSDKNLLEVIDFEQHLDLQMNNGYPDIPKISGYTLEEIELSMIKKTLDLYNNNISKAARSLNLSRGTLYRKLEKHNICHENKK